MPTYVHIRYFLNHTLVIQPVVQSLLQDQYKRSVRSSDPLFLNRYYYSMHNSAASTPAILFTMIYAGGRRLHDLSLSWILQ
jgi:hypothetical protein